MITRIVKMSFKPEKLAEFVTIFYETQAFIQQADGCIKTELFYDVKKPNQYFTISCWDSEINLENYRKSQLFKITWARVKPLFDQKAEAWSLEPAINPVS